MIQEYGPLWGNWYLQERIGSGSFGTVYKAKQEIPGHTYYSAVKHISYPRDEEQLMTIQAEQETEDEELIRDYCRKVIEDIILEYDLQRQFSGNRNFVQVYDIMDLPKKEMPGYDLFIRMELLQSMLTRFQGKENHEKEAIRLGMDICSALKALHGKNIVHRDIKVQNILVSDEGVYKLADFGTARQLTGSQSYMSIRGNLETVAPEVIIGKGVSFVSDIYSLGLMLYKLLNHHLQPFMEKGQIQDEEARMRRLSGEKLPAPAEASPAMAEVILRACAYDPSDRFASAEEMLEALRSIRDGKPRHAPEIQKIREEMNAISLMIGKEQAETALRQLQARIEQLPKNLPETKELQNSVNDLLERHQKMAEAAQAETEWKNRIGELTRQMDVLEQKIGKEKGTAELRRIQRELAGMDQNRPETRAALKRCNDLLDRQLRAVARMEQEKEQLTQLSLQMTEWEQKIGKEEGTDGLEKILGALLKMDQSNPAALLAEARCRDLIDRQKKANAERAREEEQLAQLSLRMTEWEQKIGTVQGTDDLENILSALQKLDQTRPETMAALARCRDLIARQKNGTSDIEQLAAFSLQMDELEKKIGKENVTEEIDKVQKGLQKLNWRIPGVMAALGRCSHLMDQQMSVTRSQKAIQRIVSEIQDCEKHIGVPATTDRLENCRKALEQMEAGRSDVRDAIVYCDQVLNQQEKALHEQLQTKAFQEIQHELLSLKPRIGLEKTTAELNRIETKLGNMDKSNPLWDHSMKMCKDLQNQQKVERRKVETAETLARMENQLEACRKNISQKYTKEVLDQIEERLSSMDRSSSKWKTVSDLCAQLQKEYAHALEEEARRKLPVPQGMSAAVGWALGMLIVSFFGFMYIYSLLEKNMPTNELILILFMIVLPGIVTVIAYVSAGKHFSLVRRTDGKIVCTWKALPGKQYGIIQNGTWLVQNAKSPSVIANPAPGGQICLVEMGDKPRILKKTNLASAQVKKIT